MWNRFEQFCSGIFNIQRTIQKIEREEMEAYGLKGGYAVYLAAMSQYPDGLTSAEICEVCDRDKAAVSRTISDLEENGLVTRGGSDSAYRARILLTEEGKVAAQYVCEKIASAVELASVGLTEEDKAGFYSVLTRFSVNLQTIYRDGLPNREKV